MTSSSGQLLRAWRERRRMSQLAISAETGISTRHLSYVETGRSRPSASLILRLATALDVPLRERNGLLMAAGHAPRYKETSWDDPDLVAARTSVERYLHALDPSPAYAVDRLWRLVVANRMAELLTADVAAKLADDDGSVNMLKVIMHPDGMRSAIRNFGYVAHHLLMRLHRQAVLTADPEVTDLLEELNSYPGVGHANCTADFSDAGELYIPVEIELDGQVLTFVSAMTTFGTAVDITLAELSVETLLPADEVTADTLRGLRPTWSPPPA